MNRVLADALAVLAGEEPSQPVSLAQACEHFHDAGALRGAFQWQGEENLGRRRTRWKVLLRRALSMAASNYRRSLEPSRPRHSALLEELLQLGIETLCTSETSLQPQSSVEIAEEIVKTEGGGLDSILILGDAPALALALGRLSQHRVFWVSWNEQPLESFQQIADGLAIQVQCAGVMDPSESLPSWLRQRFQTVVLCMPIAGFGSQRALQSALQDLDSSPGNRVFWTGHPGRQLDYFGLFRILGDHDFFLDSLFHDVAGYPLDPDFANQLLQDLLEVPEAAPILDPEPLQALVSSRVEFEDLHLFRPVSEVVLKGQSLELVPLQQQDLARVDGWLTPEFSLAVGFNEDRPRPTVEELELDDWYPGHEWWVVRTKEGVPVGLVHLILDEFWTKRTLPFDIGIAEPEFRGKGLTQELVELTYFRVFQRLQALALWANVEVRNVPVCRAYRSVFFEFERQFFDPDSGQELDQIRMTADRYAELRSASKLSVSVSSAREFL